MKTTKMFLTGTLATIMTATALAAQENPSNNTGNISSELDQLVDIAELELLSDTAKSLLKEDAKEESNSNTSFQTQESSYIAIAGMNMGGFGGGMGGMPPMGGFDMGGFGGFGGMPPMGGEGGMPDFGAMFGGGMGGMPAMGDMGGFGSMPM